MPEFLVFLKKKKKKMRYSSRIDRTSKTLLSIIYGKATRARLGWSICMKKRRQKKKNFNLKNVHSPLVRSNIDEEYAIYSLKEFFNKLISSFCFDHF